MNKEILRNYWKNPQSVDLAHLKELNQLCEEYPYAVGLKQLYCKALIVHQDLNFEKVLKSTAIQTAQRGTLRSWLINDFQSNDKYLYPIFPTIEEEEEEEDFSSLTEVKEVVLENVKIEDEKIIEDIKEEVVLTVGSFLAVSPAQLAQMMKRAAQTLAESAGAVCRGGLAVNEVDHDKAIREPEADARVARWVELGAGLRLVLTPLDIAEAFQNKVLSRAGAPGRRLFVTHSCSGAGGGLT